MLDRRFNGGQVLRGVFVRRLFVNRILVRRCFVRRIAVRRCFVLWLLVTRPLDKEGRHAYRRRTIWDRDRTSRRGGRLLRRSSSEPRKRSDRRTNNVPKPRRRGAGVAL